MPARQDAVEHGRDHDADIAADPAADGEGLEDAAADGAPSITVTVGAREGGFYVEDNGVGIPEELRERVIESGYPGGDGTRFGLPIVNQIAEAHGWRVSVTEGAEGGARFEFDGVRRPDGR